jgi:hypothetical protein
MHSQVLTEALFEHMMAQSLALKDLETLKRERWTSLYASADKMKLKPSLWQKLLEDLHVLKDEIEAGDQAAKAAAAAAQAGAGSSDMLNLVLALDNLDVDEREAQKIASAMQRGRRNAVASLEWGDENPMEAAAAAATAAAAAAAAAAGSGAGRRRHSTPDASTVSMSLWSSLPQDRVEQALAKAARDDEGEDASSSASSASSSEEEEEEEGEDSMIEQRPQRQDGHEADETEDKTAAAAAAATAAAVGDGGGGGAQAKLGSAFRAAKRRASVEGISTSIARRGKENAFFLRHFILEIIFLPRQARDKHRKR